MIRFFNGQGIGCGCLKIIAISQFLGNNDDISILNKGNLASILINSCIAITGQNRIGYLTLTATARSSIGERSIRKLNNYVLIGIFKFKFSLRILNSFYRIGCSCSLISIICCFGCSNHYGANFLKSKLAGLCINVSHIGTGCNSIGYCTSSLSTGRRVGIRFTNPLINRIRLYKAKPILCYLIEDDVPIRIYGHSYDLIINAVAIPVKNILALNILAICLISCKQGRSNNKPHTDIMCCVIVLGVLFHPKAIVCILGPCSTTRTGHPAFIGGILQLLNGVTCGSIDSHANPPSIVISTDREIFSRPIKHSIVNYKLKVRGVTRHSAARQRRYDAKIRIDLLPISCLEDYFCGVHFEVNDLLINAVTIPVITGNIVDIFVVGNSIVKVRLIDKTPNLNTVGCILILIKGHGIAPTGRSFMLIFGIRNVRISRSYNMIANPPSILISADAGICCYPGQFIVSSIFNLNYTAFIVCRRNTICNDIYSCKACGFGIFLDTTLIQLNGIGIHAHCNNLGIVVISITVPVKSITVVKVFFTINNSIVNVSFINNTPKSDILRFVFILRIPILLEGLVGTPTRRGLILIFSIGNISIRRSSHLNANPPTVRPTSNSIVLSGPFECCTAKGNGIPFNDTSTNQSRYCTLFHYFCSINNYLRKHS